MAKKKNIESYVLLRQLIRVKIMLFILTIVLMKNGETQAYASIYYPNDDTNLMK